MNRRRMGVSGTVSALLTVLLLVSGFAVSTGLLSAVYVSQAEVMRKAVNMGEAVSERLQAFVYEDVQSNRTLLTVRNVGSTGSEVEYLMAVGYGGEVLREVRPGETLRLGVQQAITLPLADLLGPEFDNYTQVRSVMATLYLKTVKGGVFGSGYMAPPSVVTAAYATSTTTVTTEETKTETLSIETGTWTVTTWTATVIIDNPDHWPVEAYVGVAFADTFDIARAIQSDGFPDWGLQEGLKAKKKLRFLNREVVENVTSADQIRIPRYVTCWKYASGLLRTPLPAGIAGWGVSSPVAKLSRLGPTYIQLFSSGEYHGRPLCSEEGEMFQPAGMVPRYHLIEVKFPHTYMEHVWTDEVYGHTRVHINYPRTTTIVTSWRERITHHTTISTTTTYYTVVTTVPGDPPVTFSRPFTTTVRNVFRGEAVVSASTVVTATRNSFYKIYGTGTATGTVSIVVPATTITTLEGDYRDMQPVTFPGLMKADFRFYRDDRWWHVREEYQLAYIKAVNLWNTTEVLAFLDTSQGEGGTIELKVDRPVGLAAVYIFDRVVEHLPPPPPPPRFSEHCVEWVDICPTYGYGTRMGMVTPWMKTVPCDQRTGRMTVQFQCPPGNNNCGAWIAPGAGTYTEDEVQACPKDPSTGIVTCDVPSGSTIIAGYAIES